MFVDIPEKELLKNFELPLYHITLVIFLLYLHECDEQEETIAVPSELFEQEQRYER